MASSVIRISISPPTYPSFATSLSPAASITPLSLLSLVSSILLLFRSAHIRSGFGHCRPLQVHALTHTGEKPYQCTECGKAFTQQRNYKYHMSVHAGTHEFAAACPECGKVFNNGGYLSSHMKIHRNRREYACTECGRRFNQRVACTTHKRIHTGERPHACYLCDKAFTRKTLLNQHMRTHTGEKPFSCEVCGKRFADRSNMVLHQRLHSGIRPYSCGECAKAFTKKHHLKAHMSCHTGLRPYTCDHCGARFSQSSNMRTHRKKCTAPGPPRGGSTYRIKDTVREIKSLTINETRDDQLSNLRYASRRALSVPPTRFSSRPSVAGTGSGRNDSAGTRLCCPHKSSCVASSPGRQVQLAD
ncbi:gastrula zinc finger protein XlCGF8.2DB-like [Schistocerca nitens]|uniref:gastrula zinc finger protein XlCGF8.2DB-like n=1 Tax=Schistocerca nitens TaxID=7011 RepID=UPI0021187845|nr:gastrula zinc finger protein XlCGF8.2DB-like [Schistocerca nitens]